MMTNKINNVPGLEEKTLEKKERYTLADLTPAEINFFAPVFDNDDIFESKENRRIICSDLCKKAVGMLGQTKNDGDTIIFGRIMQIMLGGILATAWMGISQKVYYALLSNIIPSYYAYYVINTMLLLITMLIANDKMQYSIMFKDDTETETLLYDFFINLIEKETQEEAIQYLIDSREPMVVNVVEKNMLQSEIDCDNLKLLKYISSETRGRILNLKSSLKSISQELWKNPDNIDELRGVQGELNIRINDFMLQWEHQKQDELAEINKVFFNYAPEVLPEPEELSVLEEAKRALREAEMPSDASLELESWKEVGLIEVSEINNKKI
ncbi:hypothetical protein COB57_01120 [Candidatus Peregrinibacteria bacterium]|nr:MAG: hypothetical protein COB57_01120 [Candidatus Peregrinibacteria bacterium]